LKYTAHLRQNYTSMYIVLAASFGDAETSLLIITSGIHAAAENSPQRIKTATDGGGSRQ